MVMARERIRVVFMGVLESEIGLNTGEMLIIHDYSLMSFI